MLGRRHYRQVHKYLLKAADGVLVRRRALGAQIWIPEPFSPELRDAIDARRAEALDRLSRGASGRRRRALVLAQLRAIAPLKCDDGRGVTLRLAHTPSCFLLVCNPDAAERLRRAVAPAVRAWPALDDALRVWVLLTMDRDEHGAWQVAQIAGLVTDEHYLPVHPEHPQPDLLLTAHLVEAGRFFHKPLAYDGAAVDYPTVLLTDAGPEPVPLEISTTRGADSPRRSAREVADD